MHSTSVWDLIQIYRMCLSNPTIKSHRQELWAKGISEASTDSTVELVSQNYLSAICVAMRIQVNLHLHIHGNHNAHTQQLFLPADASAHGTHMLSQSCGHGVECTVNNKGAHSPTARPQTSQYHIWVLWYDINQTWLHCRIISMTSIKRIQIRQFLEEYSTNSYKKVALAKHTQSIQMVPAALQNKSSSPGHNKCSCEATKTKWQEAKDLLPLGNEILVGMALF